MRVEVIQEPSRSLKARFFWRRTNSNACANASWSFFLSLRVTSWIESLPTESDPRNHTKNHETQSASLSSKPANMLDCYSVIFETLALVGGDVIGGHLIRVAHQKLATGDSRDIPGLAFDSCEARDFGILLRRSFYEGQLSAITRNY